MKATIFRTLNNSSQRKIRAMMKENNIQYTERNITKEALSKEEYFEIITKFKDGIEGLLSRNSESIINDLFEKGIDINDLSVTEFYDIVVKYPNILKSPITVYGDVVLDGYNQDEVRVLIPREVRKEEMDVLLDSIHARSDSFSNNSNKQDDEPA